MPAVRLAPGTRVFPNSPCVTGPGGNGPIVKPRSGAQARAFVREWAGKGATWIKLYRHVRPEIAGAVIDEAHVRGL